MVGYGLEEDMNQSMNNNENKRKKRGHIIGKVSDSFFEYLALAGKKTKVGDMDRYDVVCSKNISYGAHSSFLLDLYRPKNEQGSLPIVFYIHGQQSQT